MTDERSALKLAPAAAYRDARSSSSLRPAGVASKDFNSFSRSRRDFFTAIDFLCRDGVGRPTLFENRHARAFPRRGRGTGAEVAEHVAQLGGGQRQARIGAAVVDAD